MANCRGAGGLHATGMGGRRRGGQLSEREDGRGGVGSGEGGTGGTYPRPQIKHSVPLQVLVRSRLLPPGSDPARFEKRLAREGEEKARRPKKRAQGSAPGPHGSPKHTRGGGGRGAGRQSEGSGAFYTLLRAVAPPHRSSSRSWGIELMVTVAEGPGGGWPRLGGRSRGTLGAT